MYANALVRRLMLLLVLPWLGVGVVSAQENLDIDTPAIRGLTASMQARHAQILPYYAGGAVGLLRDGLVALRDASAVPLPKRGAVNALVGAENQDRSALYREIARANGHPEWEPNIRAKFGERWAAKAQSGWWVQDSNGAWRKK